MTERIGSGQTDTVPPFPEHAEWFLHTNGSNDFSISRERVEEEDIPEWARIEEGRRGRETVVIVSDEPIPAAWIKPLWSSFHDLYDPLDEHGERIRRAGDERDRRFGRAAQTLAESDSASNDEPALTLDDVSPDELDELDYQQLRSLASQSPNADGNNPAEQIRADLRAALDDPGIQAKDIDTETDGESAGERA